ncbi:hypothetical protein BGZ46_000411, partial [Entomortierella lignicola]
GFWTKKTPSLIKTLSEARYHEDSQDEYSSEASHQEDDQGNNQQYNQEDDQEYNQEDDREYNQEYNQEYDQGYDQECDQEYDQGCNQEDGQECNQKDHQEYNQNGPSSEVSYQARPSSNASNHEVNEKPFSESNRQYFEESFPEDESREEPISKSLRSTSVEDVEAFDDLKEPFVMLDQSTSDELVLLQTHHADSTCAFTHRGSFFGTTTFIATYMATMFVTEMEEFGRTGIWNKRCEDTIAWEKSVGITTMSKRDRGHTGDERHQRSGGDFSDLTRRQAHIPNVMDVRRAADERVLQHSLGQIKLGMMESLKGLKTTLLTLGLDQ